MWRKRKLAVPSRQLGPSNEPRGEAHFPLEGVKVDDLSEFSIEFEPACPDNGLALFVLPGRAPSSTAPQSAPKARGAERFLRAATYSPA